jgi:glycosyltransferase involved in cell wall biosynthesis/ubiquinone/menaquinone biosynthesis C-methylase UbiE
MPRVSVIITTYNRSNFISEAIDSVLGQTFLDFEIIVIDNGSTDNTGKVLEKYDSCICYMHLQENKGRSEARNIGIKAAKGEYIAFLDDDDIWLAQKLEKQVNFLDTHPDIGLVHAFTEVIDEKGSLLENETKNRLKLYRKALRFGYTYTGMSRLCVMFLSSVMIKKECLEKIEIFDPDIKAFEDWDFYLRFALKYRIDTIPEILARYRMHEAHTAISELNRGRIQVSMKHLALVGSGSDNYSYDRIRSDFYLHLANAYYVDAQWALFRSYAMKALELNPSLIFKSRLGLHFALSLFPDRIINIIRQLKENRQQGRYVERIIPKETSGGPFTLHLKRYDFAKEFCEGKISLDAACGVGYGSVCLAEVAKEVTGIDISSEAIAYAKSNYQRDNLRFRVMDVSRLEFPDKYFDAVCSFETIEHLKQPETFISEVKRVLKDNGIFIVSTSPQGRKTIHNPKNPYHKIEFSPADFASLLKRNFMHVEIFGQRRMQSNLHYYVQKIDVLHLRACLPNFAKRKICHALKTHSWDETGLEDFVISNEGIDRAIGLIGVCQGPLK